MLLGAETVVTKTGLMDDNDMVDQNTTNFLFQVSYTTTTSNTRYIKAVVKCVASSVVVVSSPQYFK